MSCGYPVTQPFTGVHRLPNFFVTGPVLISGLLVVAQRRAGSQLLMAGADLL